MLTGKGKAGFPEETFDQRPEGGERGSHTDIWKRSLQLERTKLDPTWCVHISTEASVAGLEGARKSSRG